MVTQGWCMVISQCMQRAVWFMDQRRGTCFFVLGISTGLKMNSWHYKHLCMSLTFPREEFHWWALISLTTQSLIPAHFIYKLQAHFSEVHKLKALHTVTSVSSGMFPFEVSLLLAIEIENNLLSKSKSFVKMWERKKKI